MENICKSDIVLMHGLPASGKSSLNEIYKNVGYQIISRDSLGISMDKVLERIKNNRNKIVIDATFPTPESRKPFIDYAKHSNKSIGCHILNTSKDDALINAMLRIKKITGKFYFHDSEIPSEFQNHPQVFVMPAIFAQSKIIKTPKISEGFDEIVTTEFKRVWEENYTNKAVFIDLDGTVRETLDGEKRPLSLHNQKILPNTEQILKEYKERGYLILAITNQSDVNKGNFVDDVDDIIKETNSLIDNVIDDYKYCPHAIPAQICTCRKPQSGMGLYFRDKYSLDFERCIMVGDSTTDKTFAGRLNIKYIEAKEFFNR